MTDEPNGDTKDETVANKIHRENSGLNTAQVNELFAKYGPNAMSDEKPSLFKKVLHWLISPMSLLLLAASLLSFYIGKAFDGWFILALFLVNFGIAQWHESKADEAIETLQKKLTINVSVKRDGQWKSIPSTMLVPGDLVQLGVGNVIPADLTIIECDNVSINESALTGESLPQEKSVNQAAFSGSFITTGDLTGAVTQTGMRTKFGRTLGLVSSKPKNSSLDRDILTITEFLTAVSLISAVAITIYLGLKHQSIPTLLTLDLSMLIAGTPVAMPTVMSLIISLGVVRLTKKHAIVRRLSSLEDLANVNMLLSDKTGTLTKNEIVVEDIVLYQDHNLKEVLKWAISGTKTDLPDPINQAIVTRAAVDDIKQFEQIKFTPADSKRKRSTAIVKKDGQDYTVSIGAPQIIEQLCNINEELRQKFNADIEHAAALGYRSLAIALTSGQNERQLELIGMMLLSDTLREDSGKVISFLKDNGIGVKMMTGDNKAIAARVAQKLGFNKQVMVAAGKTASLSMEAFNATDVFAEVLPDDKFNIVKAGAKAYVVAATGDGVNDLPALKQASVGIAVKNAVDALKSAADIVLMTNGIGVIRNAIIEARKIFMRTYYYSVYRISESFRLILTIAILSVLYGTFPMTPVQIILLALLNDLPIISLAYDKVEATSKPEAINVRRRFTLASMYGTIGIMESLGLFFIIKYLLHLSIYDIQTMFFLKLAVSGDLLIYVAHTKRHWWRWLPSKQVILATMGTQITSTLLALTGVLFHGISIWLVLIVWGWALLWMQFEELAKQIFQKYSNTI